MVILIPTIKLKITTKLKTVDRVFKELLTNVSRELSTTLDRNCVVTDLRH